jgi:hypothetical protein
MDRKTLIIEAELADVQTALEPYLRQPLLSQTGRLVCVQDVLLDRMTDEAIQQIANAFSVPLRGIRMLPELPTEPRGQILALPVRTGTGS